MTAIIAPAIAPPFEDEDSLFFGVALIAVAELNPAAGEPVGFYGNLSESASE